jgi:hypothetical protein
MEEVRWIISIRLLDSPLPFYGSTVRAAVDCFPYDIAIHIIIMLTLPVGISSVLGEKCLR